MTRLIFMLLSVLLIITDIKGQQSGTYGDGMPDNECIFSFPSGNTIESDNSFSMAVGIGIVISDVMALNPAYRVTSLLLKAGLHSAGVIDMGISDEDTTESNIYNTINELFSKTWECTISYIDNTIASAELTNEIEAIQSAYLDLVLYMEYFLSNNSNIDMVHYYENLVKDQIDDLVDEIAYYDTITPQDCRGKMPLITMMMDIKIIAYAAYYLSYNITDIKDLSYTYSSEFRLQNGKLLEIYSKCAPYALYDILYNSNSLTISDITSELDNLFISGDVFCDYIDATYKWTIDASGQQNYIFYNEGDLSYWESACNRYKWIEYITDEFINLYSTDVFDGYDLSVSTLWPSTTTAVFMMLTGTGTENSAGPVWNPCQPWDRSGFIGCINSIDYGTYSSQSDNSFDFVYGVAYAYDDNTYGEIRYSFIDGIDSCTNDMNTRKLSDVSLGCNSNQFRGQNTISLKCPNNDEYITGLRYMTLSESNIQAEIIQTQIAGFEVICSNLDYIGTPNIYYNSDTQFQMLPYDLENSDSYLAQFKKFSPWFICPPGYEISINMQIYTDCYKQDSASIDWFKCAMKYDWYGYTTDQNVNLKCVEIYEHSEKTIEDAMCLTWDDVNYSFYKYSGDDSYYSDDWKIWYHIAYSTRYNTNIWMLGNVASDTRNNGERECWGPADPKDCWWLNADGGHESSANGISTQYGPC